ncbi:hypothetical protein H257_03282 [Aphanomyces astaci]|uniref:Peptidase M13 N-terminal domain-containing protein n=1 Tax=Aphanomyces astaci TaxID=112090 RepID=W4H2Y1_APHAT|nr:hypothetical protein H257_03282 [Aphanomyces astaci]ETV85574.1 hypothetical protein H257_03282 [Aphanomyces astaci]|eukprot:XP_009825592.1 hypothetical protein H257_03282 [Aphanomyces astaci]
MGIRWIGLNDLPAWFSAATTGSVTELPEYVTKLIDYPANPCDDFYQYACGAWHKDAVIPPDRPSTDTAFFKIAIQNEAVLKKILSDNKTKLCEFYNSCLDTATLSSLGVAPLADSLKAIRSANTTLDLLVASVDDANEAKNALFGLAHCRTSGGCDAGEHRFGLYNFEETEAAVSPYTAFTFYQLDQKYPLLIGSWLKANGFNVHDQSGGSNDWKYPLLIGSWLKGNGFNVRDGCGGSNDWVGLTALTYFDKTEALLKNTTLDDIRTIVEYKLIHASSTHLTPEFLTANWNLFGKRIDGEEVEPTHAVWSADSAMTADELVRALESSFSTGIATTDWLDNSTRANAQRKLSKLVHLLGGPEKPRLYPTLTLDSNSYLNNRWKISQVNIDTGGS